MFVTPVVDSGDVNVGASNWNLLARREPLLGLVT